MLAIFPSDVLENDKMIIGAQAMKDHQVIFDGRPPLKDYDYNMILINLINSTQYTKGILNVMKFSEKIGEFNTKVGSFEIVIIVTLLSCLPLAATLTVFFIG